jgi:diguanylate cyclase (GGDEF)-like protein
VDTLHVLIIDDDKDIAGFFSTVLSLLGHECEVVLSAREALIRLSSSVPDLILLDMRLGSEVGGDDILYQIRSNPRFDATRVVVITAYPMVAEMVTKLADLILIKPVEVEQLKTLIGNMEGYQVGPKRSPFRDPVTQLFNRDYFITRLELAFDRVRRRPDFLFAVVIIDVELEGVGEDAPDSEIRVHTLREISERLRCHLRPMDATAKFTGWRFATLHEELKRPEDLEIIKSRIFDNLSAPIQFNDSAYQATIHLGAALFNKLYKLPVEILKAAEKELK